MMRIRIESLENQSGIDFLWKFKAYKEQIYISSCDTWLGAFDEKNLVGCIGVKGKRIRCFFVKKEYRHNGIGDKLIKAVLENNDTPYTAYATIHSENLFLKNGFKAIYRKNTTFMRRKEIAKED